MIPMPQAAFQDRPLSSYFTDPYLRDRFAAAERDLPPAALAVAIEPDAPLAPSAVVGQSVEDRSRVGRGGGTG